MNEFHMNFTDAQLTEIDKPTAWQSENSDNDHNQDCSSMVFGYLYCALELCSLSLLSSQLRISK